MKKILFFSDLDSTLIYSKNPEHVCVECEGLREITYMTRNALAILQTLLQRDDFMFIPCTLRSCEQTSRINYIKNGQVSLMVCDNGFSIYNKGNLDIRWDKIMREKLSAYPHNDIYRIIESFVESKHTECKFKVNRDAFFTIIFETPETAKVLKNEIINKLSRYEYKFNFHGRKLYVIPKFLDKEFAVKYICEEFKNADIITAGDSFVDKAFIELGRIKLLPKHSLLSIDNSIKTHNIGIYAGEEILDIVLSKMK